MTIAEIAREAGTSTATVSRALTNPSIVEPGTLKLIREIMIRNNFSPRRDKRRSRTAMDFASRKTRTFAFLFPDETKAGMRTELSIGLTHGIESYLYEHDANLLVTYLRPGKKLPACLDGNQVNGVIIRGDHVDEAILAQIADIPKVWLLDIGNPPAGIDRISEDNLTIGELAIDTLNREGCKSVFILKPFSPDRPHLSCETRAMSAIHRAAGLGMEVKVFYVGERLGNELDLDQESALMFMKEFNKSEWPEGIFICNKRILFKANSSKRTLEPFATVDFNVEQLGRVAAEQLIWRCNNPGAEARRILLAPRLVEHTDDFTGKTGRQAPIRGQVKVCGC